MLYDNWWDTAEDVDMGGTDDSTKDHAVKVWTPGPRGEVLEIGCGKGRLIDFLATDFPGNNFTGYDPSKQLLAQAPTNRRVKYVSKLPNKEFEFIYCMLVFQHIPDDAKQDSIDWAAKHLANNGRFRFQYVTTGEQAPRNFPIDDEDIFEFCMLANLRPDITVDDKYPQWSWCTARPA